MKRIQTFRKDSGFDITDRINVTLEARDEVREAVALFGDYIAAQVLADKLLCDSMKQAPDAVMLDFDTYKLKALITKANA